MEKKKIRSLDQSSSAVRALIRRAVLLGHVYTKDVPFASEKDVSRWVDGLFSKLESQRGSFSSLDVAILMACACGGFDEVCKVAD